MSEQEYFSMIILEFPSTEHVLIKLVFPWPLYTVFRQLDLF